MAFTGLSDIEEVTDVRRRGLGGELAQLGVGDALQQRIGVDQAVQPFEAVGPEPDRLRGRRPGRLLQAVEASRCAIRRLDQQCVQHGGVVGGNPSRDAIVDLPMNFGTQPVHQAVERAERGKRFIAALCNASTARLMRSAGSPHRLGYLEDGADDQLFGGIAVRRDGKRWERIAAW